MWSPGVVKADPVTDDATGMLQGLEPVSMRALLLERSDEPLHHPVLFRTVGPDELLPRLTAAHEGGVTSRDED